MTIINRKFAHKFTGLKGNRTVSERPRGMKSMTRKTINAIFAALLIVAAAPLVNAAETDNLRQNPQVLERARAASGDAADPGFRAALGLSGDEGLDELRAYADGLGGTVTRYRQTYRGAGPEPARARGGRPCDRAPAASSISEQRGCAASDEGPGMVRLPRHR
jgi:hypothetical protein